MREQNCAQAQRPVVTIHDAGAFAGMRKAGRLAASILDEVDRLIIPGTSPFDIDLFCERTIRQAGAVPATLGYRGYPASSCISRNSTVCHGIPDKTPLVDGDIVNVDVTVILDGWHGDTSRTYFAGVPDQKAIDLTIHAFEAMWRGIKAAGPGKTLGDIGHAIQEYAQQRGYSIVKNYCGHGIGRDFHGPPQVLNFGNPGLGLKLQPGMFFTIEPMLNTGSARTRLLDDGWTAVTEDGGLSAQFEHTIAITPNGTEVFTLSPKGLHHPLVSKRPG